MAKVVKTAQSMYSVNMSFPDPRYLQQLTDHLAKKVEQYQTPGERLAMLSGAALNWIAEYVLDPSIGWTLEMLSVDDLYLTGTGPEWNAIIIDRAQHSPTQLRTLMHENAEVQKLFSREVFSDVPILIRYEENKYKVLDGMHRAVVAIRDDHATIRAYVGRQQKTPQPICEAHVLYDLIRAYQRGGKKDAEALVSALRFLHHHYSNVGRLLHGRFGPQWFPDQDVQECIKKALTDPVLLA